MAYETHTQNLRPLLREQATIKQIILDISMGVKEKNKSM